jgi:hypothetical protein
MGFHHWKTWPHSSNGRGVPPWAPRVARHGRPYTGLGQPWTRAKGKARNDGRSPEPNPALSAGQSRRLKSGGKAEATAA